MTDISLDNYYYGEQLKRYITVFSAIFTALKVKVGQNDLGSQTNFVRVPNTYGSQDIVVAAIRQGNTQNKPIRVPVTSTYMRGFEIDPELYVGVGTETRAVNLPLGGALPNDLKVVHKYRPIPYRMTIEFGIYASNTDQHCQMLEQVMMLFNPTLEIQTSDAFGDWAKKTVVTLQSVEMNQEFPSGATRRVITSTFVFTLPVYLSPPLNIKDDFIKEMRLKLSMAHGDEDVREVAFEDASVADQSDYDVLFSAVESPQPSPTPTITPTPSGPR
jgi:hypothetical protein